MIPPAPFVVKGRVTDEQGRGLEGVTITAHCGAGTLRPTGETKSDAEGRYTLRFREGMSIQRDGRWVVGVQAATISPRKAGFFETNLHRGGDLLMADKLPAPGENTGWKVDPAKVVLPNQPYELNFVMRPAATLEGRLVDPNNQPLTDRKTYLTGDKLPPSSSVLASATTDKDGRFRFEDVPTGFKWKFSVTDVGKDVLSKEFVFREPIEHRVALSLDAKSAADAAKLRATSYRVVKEVGANRIRDLDEDAGRFNAIDDTPEIFLASFQDFSLRSHSEESLRSSRVEVFNCLYRGETNVASDLFELSLEFEREMKPESGLERSYLDLETGEFVTNAPPGDVTFLGGESELRVRHGLNMAAVPVSSNRWDATHEEVVRELANQTNQAQVRLGGPESRRTWFFKTREGSMGVLQVVPVDEKPGTVRIRWRLVKSADSGSSRREEAPSPSAKSELRSPNPRVSPARLQFRFSDGKEGDTDMEVMSDPNDPSGRRKLYVHREAWFDESHLSSVPDDAVTLPQLIAFTLPDLDAFWQFISILRTNGGRRFAVVFDGQAICEQEIRQARGQNNLNLNAWLGASRGRVAEGVRDQRLEMVNGKLTVLGAIDERRAQAIREMFQQREESPSNPQSAIRNPQLRPSLVTSAATNVPSLDEVLAALARRDAKYRAAWLRFEYARTVNDYEHKPARTEYDTLVTHDGSFREEARARQDGEALTVRIKKVNERAVVHPSRIYMETYGLPAESAPVRYRYFAHDVGHNVENTIGLAVLGPSPIWTRDYWRAADRNGNLRIERKAVNGVDCVVLTAGGVSDALAPEYDWALIKQRETQFADYQRHGDFWFPSRIEVVQHLKDFQANISTYRDALEIRRVEVLTNAAPENLFAIPAPAVGEVVDVAYPKWNPKWESEEVGQQQVLDSVRFEHRFIWKEPLDPAEARIWQVSLGWRNREQVQRALKDSRTQGVGVPSPLLFLAPDGQKMVSAKHDEHTKRFIFFAYSAFPQFNPPEAKPAWLPAGW